MLLNMGTWLHLSLDKQAACCREVITRAAFWTLRSKKQHNLWEFNRQHAEQAAAAQQNAQETLKHGEPLVQRQEDDGSPAALETDPGSDVTVRDHCRSVDTSSPCDRGLHIRMGPSAWLLVLCHLHSIRAQDLSCLGHETGRYAFALLGMLRERCWEKDVRSRIGSMADNAQSLQ